MARSWISLSLLAAIVLLLIVSLNVGTASAQKKICRALALGGGGDRGAYEAGVIHGLVSNLPPEEVQWDVVTGISAGALNAIAVALYKIGDEKAAAEFLLNEWRTITQKDVFKQWFPGGIAEGFLLKSGLLDTTPLRRYLGSIINSTRVRNSGRRLQIGATSLTHNTFQTFDENDPDLLSAVLASSAIPGLFPVVNKGGETYVDGGATYMTPITASIRECLAIADEVHVDVVLAIAEAVNPDPDIGKKTTPFILGRTLMGVISNILMKDIQNARQAFPNAKLRIIYPRSWLPGYFLGFDHSEEMIKIGYQDALNSIHNFTKSDLF